MKLTGLVIAQDEARDLPACLDALSFCDERLVVDGGSRDETPALARAAGARLLTNPWPGYAAQRRFGLGAANGEWVLAIDADERVDPSLRTAIQAAVQRADAAGFRVRVENWFLGRRLRFGGMGRDLHLRLVRRAEVEVTERLVHEGFRVRGKVDDLPGALVHASYRNSSDFAAKMERYAALGAADAFAQGRRISRIAVALRLPFAFLRRYVFQLGFLDGYPGFVHAALRAHGDFLKGAKLRELMEARR